MLLNRNISQTLHTVETFLHVPHCEYKGYGSKSAHDTDGMTGMHRGSVLKVKSLTRDWFYSDTCGGILILLNCWCTVRC
jgi:hypothetical protein